MARLIIYFWLFFFILPSISFATVSEINLRIAYGNDLTKAPFFLRYAFGKKYHKNWSTTRYSERKNFLTTYENGREQEDARNRALARNKEYMNRERTRRQALAARVAAQRAKAEYDEQRAEDKAYKDRAQNLYLAEKSQSQELQSMLRDEQQQQQAADERASRR